MIEACFFDFNQTLVRCPPWIELEVRRFPEKILRSLAAQGLVPEPDPRDLDQAQALFQARRREANQSGVESTHLQDLDAMLEELGWGGGIAKERLAQSVAELHRACLPEAEPLPGAQTAVEALRERGLRLAVISNAAYSPFVYWALEDCGLLDQVEFCLVSADVAIRKPRSEIFHMALRRMQLQANRAVHVGDDVEKDVAAARAQGLKTVWFRPDRDSADPEQDVTADLVTARLDAIPGWITNQL